MRLSCAMMVALAVTALGRVSPAQTLAGRPPVPGAPAGVTAFVDVGVIPMDTERTLLHQTVLIREGRIAALGPVATLQVPPGAIRIDGQGRYLMPGLADMHAHLGNVGGNVERYTDSLVAERRLFVYLAEGITTIRNMDYVSAKPEDIGPRKVVNFDPKLVLEFRERAAAGAMWSPRIYTAGPWYPPQPFNPFGSSVDVPPESVATYLAAYQKMGYDFVKTHDESSELYRAVLTAAHQLGLIAAGHVRDLDAALAPGGSRSIEHLVGYWPLLEDKNEPNSESGLWGSPERARELAQKTQRSKVWNCPTLRHIQWAFGDTINFNQMVKALQDAGAQLLVGTDVPLTRPRYEKFDTTKAGDRALLRTVGDPGAVHGELEALVGAGLTSYQALAAGTRNVAAYFGTSAETGTIAVGKRADMVLLSGNPLADIRQTARPAGVMIGGRWLSGDDLARRMTALKDSLAAAPPP